MGNAKCDRKAFEEWLGQRNPDQPEFRQAVMEVVQDVEPMLEEQPQLLRQKVLERLCEPDRFLSFHITWVDDNGEIQVNQCGGRCALGPGNA
jgi:glutamate dehydrogenase (NADP+)